MPKKKKKPSKEGASPKPVPASPMTAADHHDTVEETAVGRELVDVLRLRASVASSPASQLRRHQHPTVILAPADASALDVFAEEDAFVIPCHDASRGVDNPQGLSICKIHIGDSKTGQSPLRVESERTQLKIDPGTAQVFPSFLLEGMDNAMSNPTSQEEATPSTGGMEEPTAKPVPSSPSTPFSFKIGGGGDKLYSPTTPSQTPTKKKTIKRDCWVIPLDCNWGDWLRVKFTNDARELQVRLVEGDKSTQQALKVEKARAMVGHLVRAHHLGRYVQIRQPMRLSFQGRMVDLVVEQVKSENTSEDEIVEKLKALSLENDAEFFSEMKAALSKLSRSQHGLFRITRNTEVTLVDVEPRPSEQVGVEDEPNVVGLSRVFAHTIELLEAPFRNSEQFASGTLKPARGVLLHGPSGVGKSSLASDIENIMRKSVHVERVNCLALQSKTHFIGESERQLSHHFRPMQVPRLLIFDDVHLICAKRGSSRPGADQLAATLLALIDGINEVSGQIVILAITNNPSLLDPALRRPGRLDAEVEVPIPDEPMKRGAILQFHVRKLTKQEFTDSEINELGKAAKGFTGADCKLAVKEAVRFAYDRSDSNRLHLTLDDLFAALRTVKPSAIKSVMVEIPQVLWSDIGGMEEVKRELREAIDFPASQQELYRKLRIPPPRGVLLYGPPGTGKTMIARALATEGNMNFLAVKGPELLSKWLGESERALASLFRRARMASPAIVFFDEIDAIAARRGSSDSSGGSRILSQLLTELDGIINSGSTIKGASSERVVVVGATNRPDLLDSALTRPGRIDRMVYVGLPDLKSREKILEVSLKDRRCADDIDLGKLCSEEISGGLSGAELVAVCRDAALLALDETSASVQDLPMLKMQHLEHAFASVTRQITEDMLEFYAAFRAKRTKR